MKKIIIISLFTFMLMGLVGCNKSDKEEKSTSSETNISQENESAENTDSTSADNNSTDNPEAITSGEAESSVDSSEETGDIIEGTLNFEDMPLLINGVETTYPFFLESVFNQGFSVFDADIDETYSSFDDLADVEIPGYSGITLYVDIDGLSAECMYENRGEEPILFPESQLTSVDIMQCEGWGISPDILEGYTIEDMTNILGTPSKTGTYEENGSIYNYYAWENEASTMQLKVTFHSKPDDNLASTTFTYFTNPDDASWLR